MSISVSTRDRFGMLLGGVARRWRATLDASLTEAGLSDATWGPLIHIDRSGGGISQKELAARVGIDGSSLVRLIDILAAREWVERRQDPDDRRSNLLFLTAAGKATVRKIQRILTRLETQMLADFDEAAMEVLTSALERIDARLGEMRDRGGDSA